VSEKTTLLCITGDNLVPHKSNTISLMLLDPASNLLIDVDKALFIRLAVVDNDLRTYTMIAGLDQIS
jgi:hypothetical protein